jgi:transcriptional regulator with XRE-family HTH domain
MQKHNTPEELEKILGEQIRNLRILRNLAQSDLAERAGIALNAVKRLESGQPTTTKTLVKTLKVLNRTEWLESLAPSVTVNPLQAMSSKAPRQKVFRERKSKAVMTPKMQSEGQCTNQ